MNNTPQIPPRPDNWSLEAEGFEQVTRLDYHGNEYESWQPVKKDLGKAFASFREQFRNQEPRQLRSGNSYNPPLDKIDFDNIENPNKV